MQIRPPSTQPDVVRLEPLSFIVPETFIRDFPGLILFVGAKDGTLNSRELAVLARSLEGLEVNDLRLLVAIGKFEERDEKRGVDRANYHALETEVIPSVFQTREILRSRLAILLGRGLIIQMETYMGGGLFDPGLSPHTRELLRKLKSEIDTLKATADAG